MWTPFFKKKVLKNELLKIDIRCTKNNILDILQEILFNKYQIESILKKYKTKQGDYLELSVVSDNVMKLSENNQEDSTFCKVERFKI
jgi:tellurite resistance-related uncharacterized protein